ncbi:WhiB family transcriptional regulator [Pseudonocardia sp. GCM10023141]|uniref:WhiB family transcriptional regulator n=1 Tax=Pseudonocardia sp. GCM10023141 TaxID=3252653 RepID=UPI0036207EEF
MHWWDRANCRKEQPELFFPVGTSGPALIQIAEAKSVCRRCPVVDTCLEWAMVNGLREGIWGGLTEEERRRRRPRTRTGSATSLTT